MKYLVNIHLVGGEIRTGLFFDSMEEIERYISELKQELVPVKKVVVYDADTKDALKIIRA